MGLRKKLKKVAKKAVKAVAKVTTKATTLGVGKKKLNKLGNKLRDNIATISTLEGGRKRGQRLKKLGRIGTAAGAGLVKGGPWGALAGAGLQTLREGRAGRGNVPLNLQSLGEAGLTGYAGGGLAKGIMAGGGSTLGNLIRSSPQLFSAAAPMLFGPQGQPGQAPGGDPGQYPDQSFYPGFPGGFDPTQYFGGGGGDGGGLGQLLTLQNLIGGGLLGAGLAQDVGVPDVNIPGPETVTPQIQALEARQRALDERFMAGEQTAQDELERESLERLRPLFGQEQALQSQFQQDTAQRLGGLVPQEEEAQRRLLEETGARLSPLEGQERARQQQFLDETGQRFAPLIGQEQEAQRALMSESSGRFATQRQQLQDQLAKERQQRIQDLSTGQEGVNMRAELNRLGLLDSGAFQSELGRRFGDIQRDTENQLARQSLEDVNTQQRLAESGAERLGRLRELTPSQQQQFASQNFGRLQELGAMPALEQQRLAGQGAERLSGLRQLLPTTQQQFANQNFGRLQELSALPTLTQQQLAQQGATNQATARGSQADYYRNLGTAGLQRQFGLQDTATEVGLQRALEQARLRGQRQRSLIEAGGNILGGGFGGRTPGIPQDDGGANPLGQIGDAVGNAAGNVWDWTKNLFGGDGGSSGPRSSNPNLNLPRLPNFDFPDLNLPRLPGPDEPYGGVGTPPINRQPDFGGFSLQAQQPQSGLERLRARMRRNPGTNLFPQTQEPRGLMPAFGGY